MKFIRVLKANKLTEEDIIKIYNKLGYYYTDALSSRKRTIIPVNKKTIPDMPEKLERQLKQEDKYGWYVAVPFDSLQRNLLDYLPIYGDSNGYVLKWLNPTKAQAILEDIRELKLSSFEKCPENHEALKQIKINGEII